MISVIIPTYNRSKYLEVSLNHILCQDFKDLEIIIVDDGSSDHHKIMIDMIVDVYKSNDLNIKFIRLEKNSGTVCIPRNIGISHATGKYIAPVDDDCFCLRNKFIDLFELAESTNAILAYGEREEHLNESGVLKYLKTSKTGHLQDGKQVGIDNGQFIYLKSAHDKIGYIYSINACDYHTYSEISKYGKFAYTTEAVCKYVWHGDNNSLIHKSKRQDPINILEEYKKYLNG